ncbi:Uncharacterised protein [Vibrio cholerae]|nr:Uncharacterised protein [Vibrio cholerae]
MHTTIGDNSQTFLRIITRHHTRQHKAQARFRSIHHHRLLHNRSFFRLSKHTKQLTFLQYADIEWLTFGLKP